MKAPSRTLIIVMAAAPLAVLAGCGGSGTSAPSATSPIAIGYELPLTGTVALPRKQEQEGWNLGLKEFGQSVDGTASSPTSRTPAATRRWRCPTPARWCSRSTSSSWRDHCWPVRTPRWPVSRRAADPAGQPGPLLVRPAHLRCPVRQRAEFRVAVRPARRDRGRLPLPGSRLPARDHAGHRLCASPRRTPPRPTTRSPACSRRPTTSSRASTSARWRACTAPWRTCRSDVPGRRAAGHPAAPHLAAGIHRRLDRRPAA
jgi:hypothetical protein